MAVTENAKVTEGEDRARILNLLEQAARTIDRMWLAARTDGEHSAAVSLGEASHGVHRALIALSEAHP